MKLVWRECNGFLWNAITWLHYTIPNHICGFRDQEFNQIMDSLGEEVPEYSTDMKSHSAKKSGVCLILHFNSGSWVLGSCLLKRGLDHDHGGLSHDQGDWTTTFHIIVKGCERCIITDSVVCASLLKRITPSRERFLFSFLAIFLKRAKVSNDLITSWESDHEIWWGLMKTPPRATKHRPCIVCLSETRRTFLPQQRTRMPLQRCGDIMSGLLLLACLTAKMYIIYWYVLNLLLETWNFPLVLWKIY